MPSYPICIKPLTKENWPVDFNPRSLSNKIMSVLVFEPRQNSRLTSGGFQVPRCEAAAFAGYSLCWIHPHQWWLRGTQCCISFPLSLRAFWLASFLFSQLRVLFLGDKMQVINSMIPWALRLEIELKFALAEFAQWHLSLFQTNEQKCIVWANLGWSNEAIEIRTAWSGSRLKASHCVELNVNEQKNIVGANLHLVRRDRNATFELGLACTNMTSIYLYFVGAHPWLAQTHLFSQPVPWIGNTPQFNCRFLILSPSRLRALNSSHEHVCYVKKHMSNNRVWSGDFCLTKLFYLVDKFKLIACF